MSDLTEAAAREQVELDILFYAGEYLRLTDPTPLTPEVLRSVGFAECGLGASLQLGKLQYAPNLRSCWYLCGQDAIITPIPRTLGELRQLTARLGIELKEPK